jgi:hypothetical protein
LRELHAKQDPDFVAHDQQLKYAETFAPEVLATNRLMSISTALMVGYICKSYVPQTATTTESGGNIDRAGGALQYLTPNRNEWSATKLIGTIDN